MNTLPQTIRRIREQANLTQVKFAEALNTTSQTVSRWENGTSIPSQLSELYEFCHEHGMTDEYQRLLYHWGISKATEEENEERGALSKTIKDIRLAAGLSQLALANRLGLVRTAVARWENDQIIPAGDTMLKLLKLTNEVGRPDLYQALIESASQSDEEDEHES